jgi:uncharacterized small protein (DUF1192 family)
MAFGSSAMFDEDPFAPAVRKPGSLEAQIENASIGELQERIERLRAEIAACERAIAAKQAQRAAADSVFGAHSA